jgi:hypothetical protein
VECAGGIMAESCSELLRAFFRERRSQAPNVCRFGA